VTWPRVTRWHAHIWAPINICGRVPAQPSQPSQPSPAQPSPAQGESLVGWYRRPRTRQPAPAVGCGHGPCITLQTGTRRLGFRHCDVRRGAPAPHNVDTGRSASKYRVDNECLGDGVTATAAWSPVRGRVPMQTVCRGWHWADTSIDLIENTMCGVSCNYPAQPG